MKSIFTKFLPATTFKGSRIKAWDSDKRFSVTKSYDHSCNADRNHMARAQSLNWDGTWIEGSAGQSRYVYVLSQGDRFAVDPKPRP